MDLESSPAEIFKAISGSHLSSSSSSSSISLQLPNGSLEEEGREKEEGEEKPPQVSFLCCWVLLLLLPATHLRTAANGLFFSFSRPIVRAGKKERKNPPKGALSAIGKNISIPHMGNDRFCKSIVFSSPAASPCRGSRPFSWNGEREERSGS